jgi:hypothetical protein
MSFFSKLGRRIPLDGMRVFNQIPSQYYQLSQPALNYAKILERLQQQGMAPSTFSANDFKSFSESLIQIINSDENYQNLLLGVHVPFVFSDADKLVDLGSAVETNLLPSIQKSFNDLFPQSHFKAVLQSNSELPGNIKLSEGSRYESFIQASQKGTVVGLYFPQALQEFDVDSQRRQMASLPNIQGAQICLSGAIDICAAIVGNPQLLISEDFYTPILCMAAYEHVDPRMVLLLKAYGPHLEFWCMTQMLTSTTTQVSEQWAGGLCLYINVA